MKELTTINKIKATVSIPGSKSLTHRAIIMASLAEGKSILNNPLICQDTEYSINAVKDMGAEVIGANDKLDIIGIGNKFEKSEKTKEIFFGNAGTSFRLFMSILALGKTNYYLRGTPRMEERPVGDLIKALNTLGVEIETPVNKGYPPVLIKSKGIEGGKVVIKGTESSQFISSLLIAGPYTKNGIEIEVVSESVSKPYIDLTISMMESFGVAIYRDGYKYFKVIPNQQYHPKTHFIEGDCSSASYFLAAAAVTKGEIILKNIYPFSTKQGDVGFIKILEDMGCKISLKEDEVKINGRDLNGIEVDMNSMPDMVPTLASVALFANGKTTIRNVSHLRIKESDRINCVATEWKKIGGKVEELPDGLIIHGESDFHGGKVDPHNDHRIAMSLAVIGLRVPGLLISNEECVAKSFPEFWQFWDALTNQHSL